MINRLQFLHKSELFETRDKAIEFLDGLRITRPSLFAEPVVVRYGNEKEPNVILAIGATGSGSTQATLDSSYFMIDAQGIKDDVQEKYDEIEHALAKLAFAIVDTNTLDLEKIETEDSITLKGNVKVPEKVAINESNITNIIKTNKDGLYSYVNLKFDDKTNTFTFQVNENINTFSIPVIESGKYDISKEAIVFTFTDGKTTEVNVDDLIDEWTTEGENSETPIVLTKERHTDKNTDMDDRNSDHWKDVLKADVRIAPDKEHNILKKTDDGRNLYVQGTADNIFFKDGKNVKEAIEAINTEVSSAYKGNIIFKDYANNGDYNGIAANVDVEYKKETNTLVFKRSDNDGQIVSKEFKLNSAAFINDISYDTVNETITIRYKDEDGKEQKTNIELSNLLDDWVTNSEGHNVELNKQVKPGDKDVLTADVKLTDKTNDNYQILEERDDKLYVRGTADNIVYDTEKGETVKSAFERTENELQTESDRAVSAEKALSTSVDTINSTIGSGFTTLKTETITDKFTSLSGKVDNEISERKESDEKFKKSIETLTESAETANTNITNLYNGLGDDYIGNNDSHTAENTVTNRLHRLEVSATTADANIKELSSKAASLTSSAETSNAKNLELTNSASTLFEKADALDDKIDAVSGSAHFEVGDTDTVAMSKNTDVSSHTVTANVKVSSKDKNTILVDGNNGLYASLDYDADRNVIIISDTNSDTHKKEIQLNSVSVIEYMRYDKAREVIVIGYKSNASLSETNTLEIPITDVLSEWETNNNSHSVRLVRTQHTVDGTDDLSGDVVLATEGNYTDNLIKLVTTAAYDEEMNGLYVSGDKVNESARGIAQEEAKAAADKALVDAKAYTDSVHETVKNEIKTAKENGVSDANAYTDNKVERYNHDLHDELSTLSASTVNQAVTTANGYTDNKVSDVDTKAQGYASNAETNSKNYADRLRQTSKDEISGLTTNLQQMITSEANERASGITDVNNKVSQETSARTAADNLINSNLANEANTRETADNTLQTNINTEILDRTNADNRLEGLITTTANEVKGYADTKATGAIESAKTYTNSVHDLIKGEINTAKENGVSEASAYTDNRFKAYDHTLHDELSILSASTVNQAVTTASVYTDNKVSGVDTKAQGYASDAEINSKNYADKLRQTSKDEITQAKTNLSQMIGTETIERTKAITDVNNKVDKETKDRTAADDLINTNLKSETSARQTADNTLTEKINNEVSDRTDADTSLQANIDNEASARANADTNLQTNINNEASERSKADTNLQSNITAESTARENNDNRLEGLITTTANEVKGYADKKATETLGSAKDYTNAQNVSLSGAIKTYVDNEVGDITLVGDTTKTATVSVKDKKIAADVKIASGDKNRIVANADGLYVGDISAGYNAQTNTLTINGLNGQPVLTQKLNSASFIDSINYDEATHYLNITYHTTEESSATTVNVNLTDLIKDTKADETSNTPIEITVSATSENGVSVNKIKGDVNIANNVPGNILKTVNQSGKGALYADASGILNDISAISATTKSLSTKNDSDKEEINNIERSVGLSSEGNYIPSNNPYISGATSLTDADDKLANAVSKVDESINSLMLGSKTYSVNVFTEKDDDTYASLLKADVRLSVAKGQDESELTRTEIPNGNNYEGNLLQIIKAKSNGLQIELGNSINGLYFGGSIDYGMMEGDDNING